MHRKAQVPDSQVRSCSTKDQICRWLLLNRKGNGCQYCCPDWLLTCQSVWYASGNHSSVSISWSTLQWVFVSELFSLLNIRFASVYATRGANRIGRVYKKAIFRQYTDDTYSQEIPKAAWLGFLGPVLKAEEEDVFIIHLKNFASRPYSVHPHGVFYDKESEGKSWFVPFSLLHFPWSSECQG